MSTRTSLYTIGAVFIGLTLSPASQATEHTTLRDKSPHFGEDGWDVSLGAGALSWNAPFYIGDDESGTEAIPLLEATYQKGRFYFTANDTDGLILGVTLARVDDWVLDAGFAPAITGPDFGDNHQLRHLQDRDIDGLLGLRLNHYGDHNRLSISLGQDVLGAHDGLAASIDYFHEWQIKNWLFTGSAGIAYVSDKMANHIVGVSTEEANAAIPAFQAEAGYSMGLGLKAEYPITEHWVFTSKAGLQTLSSTFEDSPITHSDLDTGSYVLTGIKYQF